MLFKYTLLVPALLVLLVVMVAPVNALPYNITVDTTKLYSKSVCSFPLDPKIACNDDGSHCIALVYDSCIISGVRVFWSTDKFQTHVQDTGTIMIGAVGSNFLDYYEIYQQELPYDVEYYPDQRAFYMVYGNAVYVGFTEAVGASPPTTLPHVYTPSAPFTDPGVQVYGEYINIDSATELTTPKDWAGAGYYCLFKQTLGYKFQDDNATNLWGIQLCQPRDTSPSDWDGVLSEFIYDVTNTTSDRAQFVALDYTQSCSAGGNSNIDNMSASAFWTGTDWKYNIEGKVDYCTGTLDVVINEDTLGSPSDNFNHHFIGGNIYWRNESAPYINGTIFKSSTTDFVSFGTPSTVYSEDGSVNETINQSDSDTAGSSTLYVWERNSATDQSNDGIWIYREANYEINIDTDDATPVSVNLFCNETGTDYYDSGYGSSFTLNTPCQNNNRLIFISDKRPSTHIDWVDIDSSCLADGLTIRAKYALTPYDHVFTVRTESNVLVPGANITIGGEGTETTNASGQASFELQTVSGSTLERNNYSTCEIRYSTDGTGTTVDYLVEKPGFQDIEGTLSAPTKTDYIGYNIWTFDTTTDTTLYESGMFLDVRLEAGSGVEVSPCSYDINASGADYIAVMKSGVPDVRTDWAEFPMQYKFNHSSSPVNITLNLTLPNGSSIVEYESMSYDESDTHTFYLPFSVDELICSSDCDCPEGVCIGKYFYDGKMDLCGTNGTCDYDVFNCQLEELCDDDVGCFDTITTQSCTTDDDCPNVCIDSNTMVWGRCGADSLCKNITYDCATECNLTANICEEIRLCQQPVPMTFKISKDLATKTTLAECNQDNVGESFCLNDWRFSKRYLDARALTIVDVAVTPYGWSYDYVAEGVDEYGIGHFSLIDGYYDFDDVLVTCADDCSLTYQFCSFGCDDELGVCVESAGGIESQIYNLMPEWLQWLLTTTVLWTFFALVIGAVLTFIPAKISNHAQPTPQLGLAGIFIIYIVGIGLGFVDALIGLMIVIGLGLALTKMLVDLMGNS